MVYHRYFVSGLLVACLQWCACALATELPFSTQGQWVQGGLIRGQVPSGSTLRLDGREVVVSEMGHFALGFGRDASSQSELVWRKPDGSEQTFALHIAAREYRIQRVNGVPQKTVKPSAEHLQRIRDEAARVRAARAGFLAREDFTQPFIWPLEGPITGVFGSQRVYNGVPKTPHFGVDVAAAKGTPVQSPMSGRVVLAEDDLFYSGGTVIIDHGMGVSSTLMHLSAVYVKVGDEVEQGQKVAAVGATGRATGPHLDWRMNWLDQRVDPQLIVPAMPAQ